MFDHLQVRFGPPLILGPVSPPEPSPGDALTIGASLTDKLGLHGFFAITPLPPMLALRLPPPEDIDALVGPAPSAIPDSRRAFFEGDLRIDTSGSIARLVLRTPFACGGDSCGIMLERLLGFSGLNGPTNDILFFLADPGFWCRDEDIDDDLGGVEGRCCWE